MAAFKISPPIAESGLRAAINVVEEPAFKRLVLEIIFNRFTDPSINVIAKVDKPFEFSMTSTELRASPGVVQFIRVAACAVIDANVIIAKTNVFMILLP
jgi:hypothetical protein